MGPKAVRVRCGHGGVVGAGHDKGESGRKAGPTVRHFLGQGEDLGP